MLRGSNFILTSLGDNRSANPSSICWFNTSIHSLCVPLAKLFLTGFPVLEAVCILLVCGGVWLLDHNISWDFSRHKLMGFRIRWDIVRILSKGFLSYLKGPVCILVFIAFHGLDILDPLVEARAIDIIWTLASSNRPMLHRLGVVVFLTDRAWVLLVDLKLSEVELLRTWFLTQRWDMDTFSPWAGLGAFHGRQDHHVFSCRHELRIGRSSSYSSQHILESPQRVFVINHVSCKALFSQLLDILRFHVGVTVSSWLVLRLRWSVVSHLLRTSLVETRGRLPPILARLTNLLHDVVLW